HRGQCAKKRVRDQPRCDSCGGKATLCKPAAEKICALFQVREAFHRDNDMWEMLGREPGTLAIVCELLNRDGICVAEGRGARKVSLDGGDINKAIKMLQKSAHIDATLRFKGLSELFTQDLEDMAAVINAEAAGEEKVKRLQPPIGTISSTPQPRSIPNEPRTMSQLDQQEGRAMDPPPDPPLPAPAALPSLVITHKQHQALEGGIRELCHVRGHDYERTRAAFKEKMARELGVEHFPELNQDQLTIVNGWLNDAWRKQ